LGGWGHRGDMNRKQEKLKETRKIERKLKVKRVKYQQKGQKY
jgi:hypothetical protein